MPRTNLRAVAIILLLGIVAFLAFRRDPAAITAQSRYGYTPDAEATQRFLAELEQPMFAQAGKECLAKAKGRDTLLYRSAQSVHRKLYGREWQVVRQSIGDCVGHGFAHGCWISACVAYELGELSEAPLMVSSESLYGGSRCEARGRSLAGYSDGSYGGAASKWIRDWGVTFRKKYAAEDGGHDLTVYSGQLAKNWGNFGNGGENDNGVFDRVAKRHPMRHVALVTTFEEAAAAIESGYCVPVCSSYGFSSQRDSDGFCRRQGTWLHCMNFCAVRYGKRPGLLCLNSWGPSWVSGPRWPDDQPDGSFWVDAATVTGMLSGRDSFAVGGIDGFRYRDLHHKEWFEPTPKELR